MRFCPGSRINRLMLIPGQKSLSWFAKTGVFRVPGQFPLPRYAASIVLCANRDNMSISGLTVFRRFCLSGYVDFENWSCPGSQKWAEIAYRDNDFCPGSKRQSIDVFTGTNLCPEEGEGLRNGAGHHCGWRQIRVREQWDEAPVAGVERDVVMIAPGFPTWKAGHNHAVYPHAPCSTGRTSPA